MKMEQKGLLIQFCPVDLFQDFTPKVILDWRLGLFKIIPFIASCNYV